MLKMIEATLNDLERLDNLYRKCATRLCEKGLDQWNDSYPNKNHFINAINNQSQFIFEDEGELVGSVILDENQSEEWHTVKWHYNKGTILIIHALAVNPTLQGKGYGRQVLNHCETYALNHGYEFIRLDVFSKNQVAIKLYEKNGYVKVGEVIFGFKPEGNQTYLCYDKKLREDDNE